MALGLRSGPRCTPPLEPGCPTSVPFASRVGGAATSPPVATRGDGGVPGPFGGGRFLRFAMTHPVAGFGFAGFDTGTST